MGMKRSNVFVKGNSTGNRFRHYVITSNKCNHFANNFSFEAAAVVMTISLFCLPVKQKMKPASMRTHLVVEPTAYNFFLLSPFFCLSLSFRLSFISWDYMLFQVFKHVRHTHSNPYLWTIFTIQGKEKMYKATRWKNGKFIQQIYVLHVSSSFNGCHFTLLYSCHRRYLRCYCCFRRPWLQNGFSMQSTSF